MNRISIFLTMSIPVLFAGWLVTAPSGAAEPFAPATPIPSGIHASMPPRPTPNSGEAVIAVGTGSAAVWPRSVPDPGTSPGLLRPDPRCTVGGGGTGSAGDVPHIVGALLRLWELVRQVPRPLLPR